jgi:hypothetical protein
MGDPVNELKRELLAAAERQQEQHSALGSAGVGRKSRRRWLERSYVGHGRRRLVALAAAALVVVVGAASAFGTAHILSNGRASRTVEGVRFSFSPRGWGPGPGRIKGTFRPSVFISKSTSGGQGAEAIVFWAGFHGGDATPCAKLLSPAARGSSADLAAAVAKAPGTKLVNGPARVTVGGRPAQHVVLTVRKNVGCDPGFFFTWRPRGPHGECGGTCWTESSVGDTIRVWIVDVGGKRLFFEAETKDQGRDLSYEISRIVRSIRFD